MQEAARAQDVQVEKAKKHHTLAQANQSRSRWPIVAGAHNPLGQHCSKCDRHTRNGCIRDYYPSRRCFALAV